MAVDIPTTPIGYVSQTYGSSTSTWWMYDGETTPELWWPQSISVYDAMRTQDAQVGSVLEAVVRPILRTPWRIDPAGARDEVVEFVAEDLGLPIVGENPDPPPRTKDRFSWLDHLELALLMLPFGHMMFEQIYRVTDDGNRAHLGKLEPRMPKTIAKIDVARDGGLISVTQWGTFDDGPQRPIPVDRLVAYVYKREGGNWLGRSILRQAYKNWLLKDRLLRVQAQTIERNGMGIPVATDAEGASADQHAAGLAMAKALRAGEAAGIALPFGATLTLMGVSGTLPDAQPAIDYHDNQIARAVLAHFLNLGQQTGTGSYALGVTFADFFTASLQTLAQQVADVATMHIVEDLVDKNWGPEEPAPRIAFDEIGSRQAATAQSITALIQAGALTPDERLEESLRQQYGLPPKEQAPDTGTAAPLLPPDQAQAPGPAQPEPVLAGGVGPKGADQPVPASIDDDDDDEPGQFESTEDIDTAALVAALASFCGEVHAAEFNDKLHPRGAGGRFRNTFARIVRALEDWENGDSPSNANPFEGHGFTREQLRDAAKKRGVTLRRGASEDDIVKALMDDVRAKRGGAKSPDAGKPVRFTLKGKDHRDLDVGVFTEPSGKLSLWEVSDSGERRKRVALADDLAGLESWANEHGEPELAGWARKERGGAEAPKAPTKRAPAKKATKVAPAKALSTDPAVREIEVENNVRAAYRDLLAGKPAGANQLVSLADLRERLAEDHDIRSAEFDLAMKRLIEQPGVLLIPESNQGALTQRQRSASVRIGGQDKHHIQFADPSPRPLPKATPAKKATKAVPTAPDVNALRTLDTEPRRDALDLLKVGTVDEPGTLKAMLREQGLPVSGRKRDLVDRLVAHLDGRKAGGVGPKDDATSVGDDLAAAVRSDVADREELSGGDMGTVELVTHNNGTKTVRKKLEDVSEVFGDAFPPERQADAEELTAVLGQAINAPVPRVLRTAPDEIHTEHVDGEVAVGIKGHLFAAARTPEEFATVGERAAARTAEIVGTPEGVRLGVLDILTGNWDRANTANWLVTPDGKPVGIDHSFTFFDDAEAKDPPPLESLGPFAALFVRAGTGSKGRNGRKPVEWDDNPLTPADVDWLRARLAAVEDDFTRAGRHDWWEFASARLEAIAPFATATESRLAP